MDFVRDINHDEMRSGFLVKSDRKKLWNVELEIYNEFRRICEKHNLRFFADHGTLLGAVRHGGFIPWDDDMDFVLFRPDYEKFKEVARKEIQYPYFLSIWYETEGIEECAAGTTMGAFMRIHDERTTAYYSDMIAPTHQGICIDIFPLDSCPNLREYSEQKIDEDPKMRHWQMLVEMSRAALERDEVLKMLCNGDFKTVIPKDQLERFALFPLKYKGEALDKYCLKHFHESEYVSFYLTSVFLSSKHFRDVVDLPFENITLPCPIGYEELLTEEYGDWHKFFVTPGHIDAYSTDIPYKEFFKMRDELRKNMVNAKPKMSRLE